MTIRTAVITAAGLGTRFLPVTKAQPKEMLPLVDKPLIQYAVEEAVDSGIEQIIIVVAPDRHVIRNYFSRSHKLEQILKQKGETKLAEKISRISSLCRIIYAEQREQLGLGHALLSARELVGREPFALILPDDIICTQVPALKQMIEVFNRYQASIIAVERVNKEDTVKYGIINPKKIAERVYQIIDLVEKPEPEDAPSDLGIVGRYILTSDIFDMLQITPPGKKGEIQLTDALALLHRQRPMYAFAFEGTRYDTGTPLGLLKATIPFALHHPEFGTEFKRYLEEIDLTD